MLFEENILAGIQLKNRIIRSATHEGLTIDGGLVSPQLIKMLTELADGGTALIITGHCAVEPEGQAGRWQTLIDRDETIPGLTELTTAVHEHGSKVVVQLAHAGAAALNSEMAKGPSEIFRPMDKKMSGAMTIDDIHRVVKNFGQAAVRAQKAGFDGVQIHAAHGYLLSQFLSPHYNHREDEYGGELQSRAKIIIDIVKEIKHQTGDDFPVMIKINSEDFIENGFTVDEMLRVCGWLELSGIDVVELSGGTMESPKHLNPVRKPDCSEWEEGYYTEAAIKFKKQMRIPLILVGGIRTFKFAQYLLKEKTADYIALSRPLIREPNLPNIWKDDPSHDSTCLSCNLCFRPLIAGRGISCLAAKRLQKN